MLKAAPVFAISPASPNACTAKASRPADTKIRTIPVTVKKRRRSIRMPAAKMAQPIPTATASPTRIAATRLDRRSAGYADGEEIEHGFEPFADDRNEREAGQREPAARREGAVDPALEIALEGPSLPAHPEEHPAQDADRDDRGHALDALLDDERQLADRRDHDDADRDRDRQRRHDAGPDARQRVAPVDLDEVRGDDADDQGGFQALAERDEERGGHDGAGSFDVGR